jgi:hypothetical protein
MAKQRQIINEDPLDDICYEVTFDFRPGQKVITKFNETGYITSCQVNVKNVHMYYIETGIDKGGWLYPEDFNPVFE